MKCTVLIGMEAHLQLRTKSKMFSPSPVRFGAPPNTLVDPVVLGLPGALPVPNREAITMALALALAVGGRLAEVTKFDRKNYFYPDLPKGYQISQYDRPLSTGGGIEIVTAQGTRTIRLRRLHLEEDTGKSLHDDRRGISRVDFNRAGTPLLEIVSEPDIASPEEARAYLNALRALVHYLDISDANMQEGNLRCEPNVNLHLEEKGVRIETAIVEIKNVNSVRNVERALRHEIERQLAEYREKGAAVADQPRSTRGYDDDRDVTFLMREKEEAHDYRYFPEPDIPPLTITEAWRQEAAKRVPELPDAKRRRLMEAYALGAYDAETLCRERSTAEYFEKVVAAGSAPKPAANWILTELSRLANERRVPVAELGLAPAHLAALIGLVARGEVARRAAIGQVLPRMLETGSEPDRLVAELGLARIDDAGALKEAARRAMAAHPQAVADFRAGKQKAFGALMGFVMHETGGKANSQLVRSVLEKMLEES
ncbi:MAG: Asp-tRNA(Asn)/Glu-tRNA(Gln) amidotransferase subunit GatB [Planctomycetota bacterium]|jgi:aspartyl-tRNA(Asn)/glutamyl-tRNA(Gln) amidotransferase subunit B